VGFEPTRRARPTIFKIDCVRPLGSGTAQQSPARARSIRLDTEWCVQKCVQNAAQGCESGPSDEPNADALQRSSAQRRQYVIGMDAAMRSFGPIRA